jgi:hypothetical protein
MSTPPETRFPQPRLFKRRIAHGTFRQASHLLRSQDAHRYLLRRVMVDTITPRRMACHRGREIMGTQVVRGPPDVQAVRPV